MPPRTFTNPPPQTASARQAALSFFCQLCQKGYTRQPDFDAHLASYDHQHKQRLKDLRYMTRPARSTGGGIGGSIGGGSGGTGSIKIPIGGDAGGFVSITSVKLSDDKNGKNKTGFKKGGFRRAFMDDEDRRRDDAERESEKERQRDEGQEAGVSSRKRRNDSDDYDDDDDDYDARNGKEQYDPAHPTDCDDLCPCRAGVTA